MFLLLPPFLLEIALLENDALDRLLDVFDLPIELLNLKSMRRLRAASRGDRGDRNHGDDQRQDSQELRNEQPILGKETADGHQRPTLFCSKTRSAR